MNETIIQRVPRKTTQVKLIPAALVSLRIHQWAKNLLVFLPLLASHRLTNAPAILHSLAAFAAFCFTASSIYLVNDLIDINSDRVHPKKRYRPLASGQISIPQAIIMVIGLIGLGITATLIWLPETFAAWIVIYFILSNLYSLFLKQCLLVDVFALAGLYSVRIFAGGAATGIVISEWLMAFSMFLFLSLAFVKRFTEVQGYSFQGNEKLPGRAYASSDLGILRTVGPTSGYLSILVLALYINSPDVQLLYKNPKVLWLVCPVVGYWITRIWFIANRGHLHYDPVMFALTDFKSYLTGVICAAIAITACI